MNKITFEMEGITMIISGFTDKQIERIQHLTYGIMKENLPTKQTEADK